MKGHTLRMFCEYITVGVLNVQQVHKMEHESRVSATFSTNVQHLHRSALFSCVCLYLNIETTYVDMIVSQIQHVNWLFRL